MCHCTWVTLEFEARCYFSSPVGSDDIQNFRQESVCIHNNKRFVDVWTLLCIYKFLQISIVSLPYIIICLPMTVTSKIF